MLESFPVLLVVGSILGFLAGLGVGGGSLLMLWLTLVMGIESPVARNNNLLFFIPGAVISSLFRWKQGSIDIKTIIPGIIAGCLSAGICAYISKWLDVTLIKKLFGILLLFTGIRELFYKQKQQNGEE
jgi:uncharacterized membrane protein YfcA